MRLPTPLAAALGLLPAAAEGVRRLPRRVVALPVIAISTGLTAAETARREYDDLAERGERLVASLIPGGRQEEPVARQEPAAQPAAPPPPEPARVDSAAPPEVVETVEQVSAVVSAPEVTDHSDLPLPDYDHMTLGSLRGRLRSLSLEQLVALRDYEKSKADRLPVVTMLDNRIAKLATGEAAPTGHLPRPTS